MEIVERIKNIVGFELFEHTEGEYVYLMADDTNFGAMLLEQRDDNSIVVHSCTFPKKAKIRALKQVEKAEGGAFCKRIKDGEEVLVPVEKVIAKLTQKPREL